MESYIDKTGKVIIEPQFDFALTFSEGLAIVKIGDKFGYIDKTGKTIIKPQFDAARDFSEGLAAVGIGHDDWYWPGDPAGKSSMIAAAQTTINKNSPKFCRWGYIDKTGKMIIEPQLWHVGNFSEGLASVTDTSKEEIPVCFSTWGGERSFSIQADEGYIDKTGKMIIDSQFNRDYHGN